MIDVHPYSNKNKFRKKRLELLKRLIGKILAKKPNCRILDIGGTYAFWHTWRSEIDWNRIEIVCVNLNPRNSDEGKEDLSVRMVTGDACDLVWVQDKEFDIAFSNSVIEHVGIWRDMKAMAAEVKRVAGTYIVQTPNYWFPIEPHARTLFLHWMPEPWAYRLVMARKCGFWERQTTVSDAVTTVQSAKLIDFREMRTLFDDATILREKFVGLTKSFIAIKGL